MLEQVDNIEQEQDEEPEGDDVATDLPLPIPEPVKQKEASTDDDQAPLVNQGEYFSGLWSGVPQFQCPYCAHAIVTRRGDGPGTIELHILAAIDNGDPRHLRALDLK